MEVAPADDDPSQSHRAVVLRIAVAPSARDVRLLRVRARAYRAILYLKKLVEQAGFRGRYWSPTLGIRPPPAEIYWSLVLWIALPRIETYCELLSEALR